MQFDDVRSMMKLPRATQGLSGGCNFAVVVALCSLLSGVAKVLYTRRPGLPGTGDGFVALLIEYFPWQHGREEPAANADTLWHLVRNPLVHSLGVGVSPRQRDAQVTIVKSAYTERQLREIERSASPPKPSLALVTRGKHHTIWVVGLYWGVLKLLSRLFADRRQMVAAERKLQERGWQSDA